MFNFYNLPKHFQKADYEKACDLAAASFKNNPDIRAAYLEGGEWAPGISDVDITVVYNDKIENRAAVQSPWSLSEKAKYLFLHTYGSYNEESFRNFYYLVPDKINLRLIYGKAVPILDAHKELSSKDYKFLNAILIFDFLVQKLLFYPLRLMSKTQDARRLLGEIHSITYTLGMMEALTGEQMGGDFSAEIKRLRKNWFEEDLEKNLKNLASLLNEGIDLILDMVIKLNDFIKSQSLPADSRIIFKNRKYYIIFDEKWSKEKFLQSFFKGYLVLKNPYSKRAVENFKLVLPPYLSYFLMAYSSYQGPLSDWIRGGLLNYKKLENFFVPAGIEKHIINTNNLAQADIENKGLFRIPFSYGLLTGRRTIASKIGEKLILFLRTIKK